MGPSILFDKSAIQSLGKQALTEVSRYFYTTVPPVLLMEILADLSLKPNDLEASKTKVRVLAHKALPINSISNCHYHSLCVHNLLGEAIPMDRLPVVGRGKSVETKDGQQGMFIDMQPENEAVLRWQSGRFNDDDLKFAIEWREKAKGANLDKAMQLFGKPPFKIRSLEQVKTFVDFILADPEFQEPMLHVFLEILQCDKSTCDRVAFRWRLAIRRSFTAFAPYAAHCLRVQLAFYIGMSHGLLGTRSSNIVDLEYLHYTPFALIFCSGDKLHQQLAPLVLGNDQSFVNAQEMWEALNEIAAARGTSADAEPGESSLIWKLWQKHWGKPPRRAIRKSISEEESKRIMEQCGPIIEALREQERKSGPRFPV